MTRCTGVGIGRTWVFRYEDVIATLINSDSLEANEADVAVALGFEENCPFHNFQQHSMISQNPPRHTRQRKAQAYFGKHQLKPLTPAIRAACDELIDGFPGTGSSSSRRDTGTREGGGPERTPSDPARFASRGAAAAAPRTAG